MKNQDDDAVLIAQFRDPSLREKAFGNIVSKYQQRIYWQIRRYVSRHDDADDIMQEVFIKVWKNLEQFREDAQLYTWIFRIAYNESISHLRKIQRHPMSDIADHENAMPSNAAAGLELSAHQIQQKLLAAIDTLPDKQKLVFHMRYFDELKYEEISAQLGTSVGALKASYHLAAKKIEEFLTSN
jgi:RNA polymerase sigma-70 factor (ECF subfamily)